MQNASNPEYIQLRNQALQEDDAMHKAFDEASRAYDQGDGARAKQLSNQGHAHQKNRDQLNDKAADWIFNSNNQNQPRGTIDLHGLYVQEAIEKTERAVQVRANSSLLLHQRLGWTINIAFLLSCLVMIITGCSISRLA